MVTKKDLELIAKTIRELPLSDEDRTTVAVNFAEALQTTNPRFNKEQFLRACGVAA